MNRTATQGKLGAGVDSRMVEHYIRDRACWREGGRSGWSGGYSLPLIGKV